jgi:hypothetical protein
VANAVRRADPGLPAAMARLLVVPEGKRLSELERLRQPPTRSTGTAMARALERVDEISSFQLGRVNLSRSAGPTRAPAFWTARGGRRCARTSWLG